MSSTTGGFEGLDGVQSGMASKKIIDALVASRQERVDQLAAKKVDLKTRVGLYEKVQGMVNDLKHVATTLSMSSSLGQFAAVSNHAEAVEGFVTGTAQLGAFKVEVESVAQAARQYSDGFESATKKGLLSEGSLAIAVGSDRNATFSVDRDTSLQDLRDRINKAGLGVNAAIVHSSNAYSLVLTGLKSGAQHQLQVTETPLDRGEDAPQLLNFGNHIASAAQDTVIRVDGQQSKFTSSTTTVEGAIPGVSLKISAGAETKKDIEINLEVNAESVKAQLDQFVGVYNRLMRVLYESTKKRPAKPDPRMPITMDQQEDPDDWYNFNLDGTKSPSDKKVVNPDRYKLTGDKSVARLAEALQKMINDPLDGITSGPRAPSHVGMVGTRDETGNLRKDGTITIDEKKLNNAIMSDYEGFLQVFTNDPLIGTRGLFAKVQTVLQDYSYNEANRSGPLDSGIEGMRADIRRYDAEMETRQRSVDSYRKVLSAQFVDMEKFMAKHKAQGDYLNAVASAISKR